MKTVGLLTVVGLVPLVFAEKAQGLILVEEGQPRAQIVISAQPSAQAKQAAEVLQEYIEKISGAVLPIRNAGQPLTGPPVAVFLGQSDVLRDLAVKAPSGFTYNMNEEGFLIRTVDGHLVIAGNEDWNYRGTIYAVYDFLERLGCRWFFPGSYGEVVPKTNTISVGDLNILERPSFRFRNIWYSGWMATDAQDGAEMSKWYDCNKAHALPVPSLPADGTVTRLAPPEKYFDTNPEIFALERDGKTRSREMLCLTEPKTLEIAVKTITDTFRSDPSALTFGFAGPDGPAVCYCPNCQKELKGFTGKGLGDPSVSDFWFKFVNKVASEVKKEFPDRWLLTNGYADRVRLPEGVGPLSDNIGIQSALIAACTLHPIADPKCWSRQDYEQILSQWTEAIPCVFIYDYDPGKGLENLPFPAVHNLKHDIPWLKQRGVWGFWTEGQNNWMVTHLNYYIRAKLMWDAEADVDALVRDYCEKFYGNAADAVERYFWTLENVVNESPVHLHWGQAIPWRAILSPDVLRDLDSEIAAAEAMADTSEHREHVRVLNLVHQHMKAYLAMDVAASEGKWQEAIRWADEMQKVRVELAKVETGLIPFTSTPDYTRNSDTSLEWYRDFYQTMADRAGGTRGDLVALLPREWEFAPDPEEDGQIYKWYLPGRGGRWRDIDTTTYWQLQGYQDERGVGYGGKAWYRTSFYVPSEAEGKPLTLTFGGIHNRGLWIWVNGSLIDYRPGQGSGPFDVGVTGHIKAGQVNDIAVMVNTSPRSQRGGLYCRAFLWSPR